MTLTALKPTLQVQVWSIQALLMDDKPRIFAEVEQELGFNPEAALNHMLAAGSVEKVRVEHVIFWKRKARRK